MRAQSVNLLRALTLLAGATIYERVYGAGPVCERFFTSETCSQEHDFTSIISPLMKFFDDTSEVAGIHTGTGTLMRKRNLNTMAQCESICKQAVPGECVIESQQGDICWDELLEFLWNLSVWK